MLTVSVITSTHWENPPVLTENNTWLGSPYEEDVSESTADKGQIENDAFVNGAETKTEFLL